MLLHVVAVVMVVPVGVAGARFGIDDCGQYTTV